MSAIFESNIINKFEKLSKWFTVESWTLKTYNVKGLVFRDSLSIPNPQTYELW